MELPSETLMKKPLQGVRVLVTRPKASARAFSEQLRALGAEPIVLPTIQFSPPKDFSQVDQAIAALKECPYDWVIFTSANGVRFFWERFCNLGPEARVFSETQLAAIGPATAQALVERGLKVDFMPKRFLAEEIANGIGDVVRCRILLPRADIARRALTQLLREKGAHVDEVAVYRTLPADEGSAQVHRVKTMLEQGEINVITFTSSSTVRHLLELLEDSSLLENVAVACIGPITAATAQELGLHVDIIAREHTIDGLLQALMEEAKSHAQAQN